MITGLPPTQRWIRGTCIRIAVVAVVVGTSLPVHAQANGVRFVFPHVDPIYKDDGFPSVALGLGFDHDLDQRMTASLEFTFLARGVIGSVSDSYNTDALSHGGWNASWEDERGTWTFLYRTAYSFWDNSDNSLYLGTYIGVRGIRRDLTIVDQYDTQGSWSSGPGPFRSRYSGEKTVFPLGLRFGFRSPLSDGFFSDGYVGLGYQIGGGKNLYAQPEMNDGPFVLSGLVWQAGFAYGIGW